MLCVKSQHPRAGLSIEQLMYTKQMLYCKGLRLRGYRHGLLRDQAQSVLPSVYDIDIPMSSLSSEHDIFSSGGGRVAGRSAYLHYDYRLETSC